MANVIKEGGLRLKEAGVDQPLEVCLHVASERLGKGDPVKVAGSSGQVTGVPGVYAQTVALCASGDRIYGVVQGVCREVVATSMNLDVTHAVSGVSTYVLVRPANPYDVYAITEDGTLAVTDVGQNADITGNGGGTTVTECNSVTGQSTVELDTSTAAASTGQLKIIGYENTVDNTPGAANSSILVRINESSIVGVGADGV